MNTVNPMEHSIAQAANDLYDVAALASAVQDMIASADPNGADGMCRVLRILEGRVTEVINALERLHLSQIRGGAQ